MMRTLRPTMLTLSSALMLSAFTGCKESDSSTGSVADTHSGAGGDTGTMPNEGSAGGPSSANSSEPVTSSPEPSSVAPDPTNPDEAPMPTTSATTTVAPPAPTAPTPTMDAGTPVDPAPGPTSTAAPDSGTPEDDGWQLDWMDDPVDNPVVCPADEPAVGDPCPEYELVCKYGDETNCRSRWVCGQNDTWYMQFAKRDCPDVCPADEPTEGDPCDSDLTQCTYGPDPTCRSQWMCFESKWTLVFPAKECAEQNNCPEEPPRVGFDCDPYLFENGCVYTTAYWCGCNCAWDEEAMSSGIPTTRWYCRNIESSFPPDYLRSCPTEVPTDGTPCDTGSTCGYQTLDECNGYGEGTTLANCVDGLWSVQLPPLTNF